MNWEILGNSIENEDGVVTISQANRRQHTYILGRTGGGKTTLLGRLALADIARGDGLLVLDPHGDLVEDIIDHCPPEHLDRIIYLDPSDREHPVPMNIFECRPGQDKDTVCSEVIGIFKRLFGDSWGFRLEDLLRNLTLAMLDHQLLANDDVPEEHRYNATLKEAHDFLLNQNMRREYYPYISNQMVRDFWMHQYDNLGKLRSPATVTFAQINYASSVTNKIRRFLLNTLVFDISANKNAVNTIDLREIMDEKKVLLVNLAKGKLGEDNSALIGSVLLSRLVVAALSRANMPKGDREERVFHVIADEFQAFATDSFKLLLSEARKYGVTLTVAHQHREQLDQEMKGAVLNCGSLLCFRIAGRDAADIGREFDAAPRIQGVSFESQKQPDDPSALDRWISSKLERFSPTMKPLYDRRKALIDEWNQIEENCTALKAENDRTNKTKCKLASHELCSHPEPSTDLRDRLRHMIRVDLPRVVEIEAAVNEIDDEILAREPDVTGHGWTDIRLGSDGAWAADPDEEGEKYWEPGHRRAFYRRIVRKGSFSEREREIANSLTQLANFTVMHRLADGSSGTFTTSKMPENSADRATRLQDRREYARTAYGLAPTARASTTQAPYLETLRRLEAYEAELDERPTD